MIWLPTLFSYTSVIGCLSSATWSSFWASLPAWFFLPRNMILELILEIWMSSPFEMEIRKKFSFYWKYYKLCRTRFFGRMDPLWPFMALKNRFTRNEIWHLINEQDGLFLEATEAIIILKNSKKFQRVWNNPKKMWSFIQLVS